MLKYINLIVFSLFFTGCELITIGTIAKNEPKETVDFNQRTSLGAMYLFKAELDSNNVPAASDLIIKPDGTSYLAIERYEKFYDIFRIKRMIAKREITDLKTDTLSNIQYKYLMELDYRRKVNFKTLNVNNYWFISEMANFD